MKQTLSLKLGQQLTMTPQLQQAIRLLQLSSLDLQQEILETLESNPMLELDEEEATPDGNDIPEPDGGEAENDASGSDEGFEDADDFPELLGEGEIGGSPDAEAGDMDDFGEFNTETAAAAADETPIPEDLPVDTSWDDIYEPTTGSGTGSSDEGDWSLE